VPQHLLVTNDFPPKTGGIQVYLYELWSRLDPERFTVLTATSHPDAATFDAASPLRVTRTGTKLVFLPGLRTWRHIRRAIERENPALVLLDPAFPLGALAAFGPGLGRPYGLILHGAEVSIPARIPLVRAVFRRIIRKATVVICAGSFPEAIARELVGVDMPPVIQVPPGVDTTRFHPEPAETHAAWRTQLGLDPEAFLVSSFSRLVPRKGMDLLIRASVMARHQVPNLHLAIGGSGRDRPRLERLARRLDAPVTFLGRVDDELLSPFLASSDVMAMACKDMLGGTLVEGFGIVFVEAGAAGVPVIAGRSGGSHEAVLDQETGLVVPANDVPALAAALCALAADPDRRRQFGERAREVARDRFDWNALAQKLGSELARFGG
jgi:phosphatidylinositol alpha-1,6-mannosyltransferase